MSKNNYKPEAHAILLILQKIPCIVSWRWFKLTGWVLLQYLHPESRYDGEDMSLISIYNKNKKRRGKSKYLLSVMVDVVKDGDIISYLIAYSFFFFFEIEFCRRKIGNYTFISIFWYRKSQHSKLHFTVYNKDFCLSLCNQDNLFYEKTYKFPDDLQSPLYICE